MGLINFFSKQDNPVMNGINTVRKTADAFNQAHDAFAGIGGNPAMASMMGDTYTSRPNPSSNTRRFYDDDDDERDHAYQAPVILDDQLMKNFRKKAEMQTDLLIGELEFAYLWKRLVTKLFITNVGDEDLAKQYRNVEEDEITNLPKDVQLILRNQIHAKSIDKVTIDAVLKESIVDYFMLDYETSYRSGVMPDFSHINPIALLKQKFNNPFYKLVGDLTYDWGLKNKAEGKKLLTNVFNKLKERFTESDLEAIESIEQTINVIKETAGVSAIVLENEIVDGSVLEAEVFELPKELEEEPQTPEILVINIPTNGEEN